jgi:hypothetical protein
MDKLFLTIFEVVAKAILVTHVGNLETTLRLCVGIGALCLAFWIGCHGRKPALKEANVPTELDHSVPIERTQPVLEPQPSVALHIHLHTEGASGRKKLGSGTSVKRKRSARR